MADVFLQQISESAVRIDIDAVRYLLALYWDSLNPYWLPFDAPN
ncbi:hypothetical protein OPU71_00110 [Niveibacterium sp. 24ML]|nr:hypothetical protein [Niveibacterium sp. 24ML]